MPATNELLQEGRYRINQQTPLDGKHQLFEAFDTVRGSNVVVKEIVVRLNRVMTTSQQESLKLEFAKQAKTLVSIKHDSLLAVYDYFSEVDRQYLVMESVDGDDLAELLERNESAFAVADVVGWADQILDALNYLHTFKPPIFHLNVRPHNIKLSSDGKIKLFAFGLSEDGDARLTTALRENASDAVINYSPLEQIWEGLDAASQKVIANSYDDRSEKLLKQPPDARSDIYALGATLYHLVTGRVPVDPLERSIEMLEGNPDPLEAPHKIDSKVPVELSEVLMRSLEIRRENRFDSAVIMRQVVRTAMTRVHERDSDSGREMEEAAEDLRKVEEMRKAKTQKLAEMEKAAAELEQKRRQELLDAQARETEAKRVEAEKRAAEAARALKEKEAAAARAKEKEEERRSMTKAQAEADAVLKELKQDLLEIDADPIESGGDDPLDAEIIDVPAGNSVRTAAAKTADVVAYNSATAATGSSIRTPVAEPAAADFGGVFSAESAEPRSGLSMPIIAGIAGVIIVMAVAGWLLLSSGSQAPESRTSQPPPVVQIPPTEPSQPAQSAPETVAETSAAAPNSTDASAKAQARTAESAAKVKKPEADPAKPAAAKKKAVTVDDLISDN